MPQPDLPLLQGAGACRDELPEKEATVQAAFSQHHKGTGSQISAVPAAEPHRGDSRGPASGRPDASSCVGDSWGTATEVADKPVEMPVETPVTSHSMETALPPPESTKRKHPGSTTVEPPVSSVRREEPTAPEVTVIPETQETTATVAPEDPMDTPGDDDLFSTLEIDESAPDV